MPSIIKIERGWQALPVWPFLRPSFTYSLFFFRIWRLINPSHPEVCNISILSILTRRIKTLPFAIKVSMFMIKYFF